MIDHINRAEMRAVPMSATGKDAPCPKCHNGKPVKKFNMSPAHWLECDNCGFVLGPYNECWNDISALSMGRDEKAALVESLRDMLSYQSLAPADVIERAKNTLDKFDSSQR